MTDQRQIYLEKISEAQKTKNHKALEAALADALRDMPDDPFIMVKWAEFQAGEGKQDQARQKLKEALRLVPEGQHHMKMAICDKMFVMGMRRYAALALPAIVPQEKPQETFARIKILRTANDDIGVRKACAHLVGRADLPPERWRKVSDAARAVGYPEAAVAAFLKALAKSRASLADVARLVNLHLENNDLDNAWGVLKALPDALQQQPQLLAAKAACLRKKGQAAQAADLYLSLLEREPANISAWSGLAVLAGKDQLPALISRAERLLDEGTLQAADEMQLRFALAGMQDRLGRSQDAWSSFQLANSTLEGFFAASKRAYDPAKEEQVRAQRTGWFPSGLIGLRAEKATGDQPIFIVGLPRSGTTLLERMLASMPGVTAGGENKALARIVKEHHYQMHRRALPAPQGLDAETWQAFAENYWRITTVRDHFVTDKLPQNYRNLGWGMKMFPAAPIIYLKRDPRDVGWSLYKQTFHSTFAYSVNLEHIAHAVRECEAFMAYWQQVAPGRILTVQYETLVQEPEQTTRAIADFCGLEWTEACLSPEKLDVPAFTVSEQQVREPINEKGLGRWRAYEEFLQPMIAALHGYGLLP